MFNWIKCLYQRPLRFRRTIILPLIIFIVTTSFLYALVEYYTTNKVEFSSSSSIENFIATNVTCKTDDLFQSVEDEHCKEKLRNISCELQTNPRFYPESLPRLCPKHEGQFGDIVGCIGIHNISTLHTEQLPVLDTEIQCIDYCLKHSLPYASYNAETSRCYCSVEFPRHYRLIKSDQKCPVKTLNYDTLGQDISTLYRTGFAVFGNNLKKHPRTENDTDTVIVFFLTVGGRKSLRQIHRLIRSIYLPQHYYFLHVDQRDDYLQHELRKLPLKFPNIHVTEKRYPTTWGSSTLLNAHLDVFKEIFEELKWNFSFLINLSESDFPMKSIQVITDVLAVYRPYNFLGPHNQDPFKFLKAQAAFHTFFQCNNHMYKVKYRPLIKKIVYDGGSDWYILNRDFLRYVTYGDDELINGLRHAFNYSLLPCEMFFHTLLSNSLYCDTYIRNNLRYVNWNRKRGCKCQHTKVVDWCGCSPLVYRLSDKPSFISKRELPYFFARKFDPSIDESIIDWLDESISKKNLSNGAAYLQNLYHPIDGIEKLSTALKLFDLYARSKLVKCFHNENLQLEQIHAVFQSSVFQGYSLQYKTNQKEQIEVLISLNSLHAKLSDGVKRFETGSTFDIKELLFADRSRTFIEPDSIQVLIEWQGTGNNGTTLIINTPNNTVVERIELHSSVEPLVSDITLPNISDPSLIGVWQMSIVDDINGTQLASSDFLILSSSQGQLSVNSENLLSLTKFWSISNICSTKINSSSYSNPSLNGTIPVLTDCFHQPWSFFYFDIKTNW